MHFNSKVSNIVLIVSFLMVLSTLFVQWTFVAFSAVFQLDSLICGVATSSKLLIVGRAIAGMASSGLYNGTFINIAGCVPMAKRPSMVLLLLR